MKVLSLLLFSISMTSVYAAGDKCPRCEYFREKNKTAPAYEFYEDYLKEQAEKSGQPLPDESVKFKEETFNIQKSSF